MLFCHRDKFLSVLSFILTNVPHTHITAIVLGFERSSYTVQEADVVVEDLVALVKQEGQVTEQTITVAVNSFDLSAREGKHLSL